MSKHSIKEVRATLKYGRVINKRQFVASIIGTIIAILGTPLLLWAIFFQKEYLLILGVVLFIATSVLFFRALSKWHNERPYIKQCLDDAVEIVADCKEDKSDPKCGQYYKGKTIVEFTYNGQNFVLKNDERCFSFDDIFHIHGNDIYFKIYFGKRLKVLYSPKYNEILFLEPFAYNENGEYEVA